MNKHSFKPEWGNREHIILVRKYDDIMSGKKPLKQLSFDNDDVDEDESVLCATHRVKCPKCEVGILLELNGVDDIDFCRGCQTFFEIRQGGGVYVYQEEEEI